MENFCFSTAFQMYSSVLSALSSHPFALLSPIFAPLFLLPLFTFFTNIFALEKKCARCSSKTWRKKNFVWSLFGTIWKSRCLVMFGKVNVKVVFLWLRTEDRSVAFSSFVLINLKYYSSFPAVSLSWVMTEHNLNILFRMCECIVVCTVVSLTYQLTFLYM